MKILFPLLILILLPLPVQAQEAQTLRTVTQVIDGGHLVLDGGETVALIGVQAPPFPKDGKKNSPAVSWARRSKEFLSGLVMGRKIWLKSGEVAKNKEGQSWAFVFFKLADTQALGGGGMKPLLSSGSYMANRLVIQYGFATSGSPFSFSYRSQFKQLEQQARNQQIGLWQTNF